MCSIISKMTHKHSSFGSCLSAYFIPGSLVNKACSCIRHPRDTLDDVFVLAQLGFALAGSNDPHADRLIIGAAGNQRAISRHSHHAHPLVVPDERLHTVSTHVTQQLFTTQHYAHLLDLLKIWLSAEHSCVLFVTRSTGTVHTSAKARLTSVAIRICIQIREPDRHQNLTICSLAHCQPSLKISCKSVQKLFLCKVANRQTTGIQTTTITYPPWCR